MKDFRIRDIIKKTPQGYIIYSEKGKRLSKPFKTREAAEERLKEIEMFKHMKKDSLYKGYDIEKKGDLWQIWIDRPDGDSFVAGDFPSREEAEEWIDAQAEQPEKAQEKKPELHRYDVWYVDYGTDMALVERGVLARSPDEARRIVKKRYGNQIYGYPHDVYLADKETDMKEEIKQWLSKYLVKKEDPENKLGKTHIRPLRPEEKLPKGVRHKAKTDNSGILHYKGGDYYWYLDENDEIHVERHISSDSLGERFSCESWFDANWKNLEGREDMNDFEAAKQWCLEKRAKGYFPRIIDRREGEVWLFDEDAETELEDIEGPEDTVHIWAIEWHDENGVKFRAEFDSEEDAKDFWAKNRDAKHNAMKIVEQDVRLGDSGSPFDRDKTEKKIREILRAYIEKEGYEPEAADEWIGIHFKDFRNKEGDEGVMVEISNDLGIDYYDLPEGVAEALEKEAGFIEPYSPTVWQSIIWNAHLSDEAPEKHEVKFVTYTQFDVGFGDIEISEDEEIIDEYDTLEEAEEAAQEDSYGTYGQYIEVYVDGKRVRDYEVL